MVIEIGKWLSLHSFWGWGELTGGKRELSWVMGNVHYYFEW